MATTLFDHIALAYGSNIRTIHYLDNCPTLLTGGGANLKLGHHLVVPKDTPLVQRVAHDAPRSRH